MNQESKLIKYKNKYYPENSFFTDNYTKTNIPKERMSPCISIDANKRMLQTWSSACIRIYVGSELMTICKSSIENHPHLFVQYKNRYYLKGYKRIQPCIKGTKIYNLENLDIYYDSLVNPVKNPLFYPIGFEFETSNGELDEEYLQTLGVYKIYDGSITGHEYVSIPYTTDTLGNYFEFLNYASIFTSIDKYCSIHINIGVGLYDSLFLVGLYKLYLRLQDEIDLLIPSYKKDFMFLASKRKDHCKNLPYIHNIDEEKILQAIFGTSNLRSIRSNIESIAKYNQIWRYYALNFTKYVNNKGVLEFRILPSIYAHKYNFFFIYLFQALVKYAKNNYTKIVDNKIKIELEDVLDIYPDDLKSELVNLMKSLKDLFFKLKYEDGFDTTRLEELSKILES